MSVPVRMDKWAPTWTPPPRRIDVWMWSRSKKKTAGRCPARERVFYNIGGEIVCSPENFNWLAGMVGLGKAFKL